MAVPEEVLSQQDAKLPNEMSIILSVTPELCHLSLCDPS